HTGLAQYNNAHFSPATGRIYLLSDEGRNIMNRAEIDLMAPSPKVTFVEETPWDAEEMTLSDDGRLMAWVTNEDGYSKLHLENLVTHTELLTPPILPEGVIYSLAFSRDGKELAFVVNAPTFNGDIWMYDIEDQSYWQVTHSSRGGVPQGTFVKPQLVRYKSFDGRQIPAYLYTPNMAGRTQGLPVIFSLHGGPEGQERPYFDGVYQYFLNHGYAIFAPNIRGSTGYGKEYTHADDIEKRWDALKDIAAGVDYLKQSGYANPKKIVVMGGSYGGFASLASVTFYPDLWAAGIDLFGIANFKTFLQNTGAWRRKFREAEYGYLDKNAEFLAKISPVNSIQNVKVPMFIWQGANDPRVPKGESDQMVDGLKARGIPVEYMVADDEGHGISKLANRIKTYRAIVAFLDQYLKSAPASSSAPPAPSLASSPALSPLP
ncbi:MAG: S9 family peptidase, partial [bacterium]